MTVVAGFFLAAAFAAFAAGVAYHIAWLGIVAGVLILAASASAGWTWKKPGDGSHAGLMDRLGHPVPRLPRRWRRKDWAELESLTETAKD